MTPRALARVLALAVGACALLVPSALFAQATGAIAGVVTDATGGVLPGAAVEAAQQATGQVQCSSESSTRFEA